MAGTLSYPITVVLERVTIPSGRESLVGARRVAFSTRVAAGADGRRTQTTVLDGRTAPTVVGPARAARSVTVGRVVFEGTIEVDEPLLLVVAPAPGGEVGLDEPSVRLRAELTGDPATWNGRQIRLRSSREFDVVERPWAAVVRVEVGAPESVRLDDRGEHVDHRRLSAEWEFQAYGRPPRDPKSIATELGRRDAMPEMAGDLQLPRDEWIGEGARAMLAVQGERVIPCEPARNPSPRGSYGYASRTVQLDPDLPPGVVDLFVPFLPELPLDRDSVRLFHWDSAAKHWLPLTQSGLHPEHPTVWGRTSLRGRFVAVGMPSHPALRQTIELVRRFRPMLVQARARGETAMIERLCQLILCAPEMGEFAVIDDHGVLRHPDLPLDPRAARQELTTLMRPSAPDPAPTFGGDFPDGPMPGEPMPDGPGPGRPWPGGPIPIPGGGGDICEQCFGMPFPELMPEIDICPPYPVGPWYPYIPGYPLPPIKIWPGFATCSTWTGMGPTFPSCVIRDLAIHPDNGNVLFAAAQAGGVWRTLDGGAHWKPLTDHLPNLSAYAIAIARKKTPGATHRRVYFGTRDNGRGTEFDLYASDDNGASWQRKTAIPSTEAWEITTGKDDHDLVYFAGSASLHKSTDGGTTWVVQNVTVDGTNKVNTDGIFDGQVWDVKVDPTDDDTLWISVQGQGILVSADGGASWANRTSGVAALSGNGRILLDIGNDTGGHGTDFVVAKTGETIAYTTDAGANWTIMPAGPDHGGGTQSGWCSGLAVRPDDEETIVAGGFHLARTADATAAAPTWTRVPGLYWAPWGAPAKTDEYHPDIQVVRFDPSQTSRFYAANDGGITRVDGNGATPVRISDGINANILFHMDIAQSGTFHAGASTYHVGIVRKQPASLEWPYVEVAEGGIYRIDPRDSTLHFCNPWGSKLRRSTASGDHNSWSTITPDVGGAGEPYVHQLEFRPSGAHVIWAGTFYDRLHWSTDKGQSFTPLQDAAGTHLLLDGNNNRSAGVGSIAFAPSDARVVYVGTRGGRIWHSTTGATTSAGWSQVASVPRPAVNPTNNTQNRISAIAVHPNDPDTLYIGYAITGAPQVFVTRDGGASWTDATGGSADLRLPRLPVVGLAIDPSNPLRVFVALQFGVFVTADGGDWWRPWDDGLPSVRMSEMRLRKSTRTLYLATGGRGALYRAI